MPSVRIPTSEKDQVYFVTFTVKNWYYFFDRHDRFQILEKSFVYCQEQKQLQIYAFVFMLNHIHFIGKADDLSAVIRDMKTFLSKEFKKNIQRNEANLLKIFEKQGQFGLWQKTNYPKMIHSDKFLQQKMEYIHYNPVRKLYVHSPEDWRWSSACKFPTRIKLSAL